MRNTYSPDGHLCFWLFAHLRSIDNGSRLCYTDNIVLKVHISKFQGKDLALTKSSVDCQVKQNTDLLWYLLVNFIVTHSVGNPSVIYTLMAGDFQRIGGLNVGQEALSLLWGKEFDLLRSLYPSRQLYLFTRITVDQFPFGRCA